MCYPCGSQCQACLCHRLYSRGDWLARLLVLYIYMSSDFVKISGSGSAANTIDKCVEKVVVLPVQRPWGVGPLGHERKRFQAIRIQVRRGAYRC